MKATPSPALARAVGRLLWQRRLTLHWPLEHVAKLSGLRPGQVLSMELVADDDHFLLLLCRALNLYPPEVIAAATGAVMLAHMPAPWDDPVTDEDDDLIPF